MPPNCSACHWSSPNWQTMDSFIQQSQQAGKQGSPSSFALGRIPSPMHSASRMPPQMAQQKMPMAQTTTVMQSPTLAPQARPAGGLNIQLPDQIFQSPPMQDVVMSPSFSDNTPQNGAYHSGVTWTEDVRCVTPSEAMHRGCGTPVAAVTTPSNVATTHWRTMVCPMPPVKRRPLIPCLTRMGTGQLEAGNQTPSSERSALPSPANLWPSLPSTPVSGGPAAFPSLSDPDMMMFERQKSNSAMSTDDTPTPGRGSAKGSPPLMPAHPQRFTRLFSK